METSRRNFLAGITGAGVAGTVPLLTQLDDPPPQPPPFRQGTADYKGPNVIIIRFGGGCRRREAIEPDTTYAPYLLNTLAPRGVLFKNMMIDSLQPTQGVDTSHGQGTIYILSGSYRKLGNAGGDGLAERFVPSAPTLFEYFRSPFNISAHETLVINSEDRKQEEFLTYSNHLRYGIDYRCQILSLYRYKRFLYPRLLSQGTRDGQQLSPQQRDQITKELRELESIDTRLPTSKNEQLQGFWERWQAHYGETGFKNPRGDRLLTELALRSMQDGQIQPRMMIVNYTDCDYVHWGIPSHYTTAVAIMDQGLKQIVDAADTLPFYKDNTLFVVVPDCGRDNNPFVDVPFQHHFNSRSSHEIFCLAFGKGVENHGTVVNDVVDQVQIAGAIGSLAGFETPDAETDHLANYLA